MDIFDKVRLTMAIGRGDTHSFTHGDSCRSDVPIDSFFISSVIGNESGRQATIHRSSIQLFSFDIYEYFWSVMMLW